MQRVRPLALASAGRLPGLHVMRWVPEREPFSPGAHLTPCLPDPSSVCPGAVQLPRLSRGQGEVKGGQCPGQGDKDLLSGSCGQGPAPPTHPMMGKCLEGVSGS